MEHHKRHVLLWNILRPLVALYAKIAFNFSAKPRDIEGPYIVVANHVTDLDPIFVGVGFKRQMYFVTSDHLFRLGWVSKLLIWFQAPIGRTKSAAAANTVKAILRTVKNGYNVCLFPEGNRTWDGVTRSFPTSTGKLVRSAGCSLVTYRIDGGYFASPRWSGTTVRRGKTGGQIVGIYRPEELRAMKPAEINDTISRDIYVDAYAQQREKPVAFRGKKLAHHLETLLFTCPKCGAMHTLKSEDDRFFCKSCGMNTRYTATGFFSGGGVPFDNVRDWNAWQTGRIQKLCDEAGNGLIFRDDDFTLKHIDGENSEYIGRGSLLLFRDRLELPTGITIAVEEISGMSLRGAQTLYVSSTNGNSFELKNENICCTSKYLTACSILGSPIGWGV